jgi:hypothetical protein
MDKAVIVRGRLTGLRHIDLDEPVTGMEGAVEVVVRPLPRQIEQGQIDVFDFIARLSPGSRTKDEIDHQIQHERESWGEQ